MTRRPDRFAISSKPLPRTVARTADIEAEIFGQPEPDSLAFIHSVLAQCGLPYRAVEGQNYLRRAGRASLIVSAGFLLDPTTHEPVLQPVPYGAKPRLLLIHICTEAVRTRSPTVSIADSMSAFMRELGLHVTGGKRGSIAGFKQQLNALAASRMQMLFSDDDKQMVINPAPVVRRMDLWFPKDAKQRTLWPSEIELSSEFFTSLQEHALPLDPRAVRGLQHSARALDIYAWLAYRLPRVRAHAGDRVSWASLHAQFGPDLKDAREFRRLFSTALQQALAVYPSAKLEGEDGGFRLRKSRPPIREITA